MTTDELVHALAKDLTPVRRLPSAEWRTLGFCVFGLALVGLALAVHGLRPDWQRKLADPEFLREEVALVAVFAAAAWAAQRMAVPGRGHFAVQALPLVGLGVWLALVASRHAGFGDLGPPGIKCAARMAALAFVPLLALVLALRRAAPLEPGRALALAAWSASALGMFATQFLCPRDGTLHVLVWHGSPVVLAGVVAFALGGLRR